MPVISTGVMVLCALLCFVGAIRARLAGAPKDHRDGLITLNIALVATVFAGYVAIFDEAGFLLATALFLFLCIALLRGASPRSGGADRAGLRRSHLRGFPDGIPGAAA